MICCCCQWLCYFQNSSCCCDCCCCCCWYITASSSLSETKTFLHSEDLRWNNTERSNHVIQFGELSNDYCYHMESIVQSCFVDRIIMLTTEDIKIISISRKKNTQSNYFFLEIQWNEKRSVHHEICALYLNAYRNIKSKYAYRYVLTVTVFN